jgi:VCBS repeat-containing protein
MSRRSQCRARTWTILLAAVLTALLGVLPPTALLFAQEKDATGRPAEERNINIERDKWFLEMRRSTPDGRIPPHARARANRQLREMQEIDELLRLALPAEPLVPPPDPNSSTWTEIGPKPISTPFSYPFASGRVAALAICPTDNAIVYVGGAQGGVWRTVNGTNANGPNWTPIFDDQDVLAIGSIAIAPSDTTCNTVYVGTGEAHNSGDSYYGDGVWKTTNGLSSPPTWNHIAEGTVFTNPFGFGVPINPATFFGGPRIAALAVHPTNADIVLAAAQLASNLGGIFRTTNGGTNWTLELSFSGTTGQSVLFATSDATGATAYAALGSAFVADSDSGIYKSTDTGDTWAKVTGTGLPAATSMGRIELGMGGTSGDGTLFAIVTDVSTNSDDALGLFRSTDGGVNWTQSADAKLSGNSSFCSPQCWYDLAIAVTPGNAANLLLGGAADGDGFFLCSTTGTTTMSFSRVDSGMHVDIHAIDINQAAAANVAYVGNDGGVWRKASPFAGMTCQNTWDNLNNGNSGTDPLALTQFYTGISADPGMAAIGFGGTQDNGTLKFTDDTTWSSMTCGDGAYTAIDTINTNRVYANCQNIQILRSTDGGAGFGFGGGSWLFCQTNVSTSGNRVNFIPPMEIDNSAMAGTNQHVYFGSQRVWRLPTDGTCSWEALSATTDFGAGANEITALALHPSSSSHLWVGTDADNGTPRVWVSHNATATAASVTFTDRTASGTLPLRSLSAIAVDPNDATGGTAYLAFSGFESCPPASCDGRGHVWKTTTDGVSFTDITGDLPDIPVNDILVDPDLADTLYIATDIGVFRTQNGGTNWSLLGTGLPRSSTFGIALHPDRTLIAATHGRGAWTLSVPLQVTPTLSINDVTMAEGNAGGTTFTFTVTLSAPSANDVTFSFATSDGTATTGDNDYQASNGSCDILAGDTTCPIDIIVNGDTRDEDNETFTLTISDPVNATIADATGIGTITDDDNPPDILIGDVTMNEGNAGQSSFVFTVGLSAASGKTVQVNFATADSSATAGGILGAGGDDYESNSDTLTFVADDISETITVLVNGDNVREADEVFAVNLSGAVNANLPDPQGVGTILNDDPDPTISINDVTQLEGSGGGTTNFNFTVSLSGPAQATVTVLANTANDTAMAPGDYAAIVNQTVTFNAGETSKQVPVEVVADDVDEPNESFFVNLSNQNLFTISDSQGVGTILDDEGTPTISINNVTVTEGNAGTVNATFTVTLSPASGSDVMISFATSDVTATSGGTPEAGGQDYVAVVGGNLTIPAGQTSGQISITVNGDTTRESDETFVVDLTADANSTCAGGDCQGQVTITNDDPIPTLNIGDVSTPEGDPGANSFQFSVTLSNPSQSTIQVNFATADGTATTADGDYDANAGTLTFVAGDTAETAAVTVNGDFKFEADETFFVNLSSSVNANIGDSQGTGTIQNDDPQPNVSIDDVPIPEGSGGGTTNFIFTVTQDAVSGLDTTVNFSTADGTAVAPGDYAAQTGSVMIPAGDLTATITVAVVADNLDEDDETFNVNLTGATNAAVNDGTGVGTIQNDDVPPDLSINDVTMAEGNSGTTFFVFTASLSAPSGKTVTSNFITSDGTATTGDNDYDATNGMLTFIPGDTVETITVVVNGDTAPELDETFNVTLNTTTNATEVDGLGIGTITNDDFPSVSISDVSMNEGDAGTTNFDFTVTLSQPAPFMVTVRADTANGTATAGTDYTAIVNQTVTFAAMDTMETVTVQVNGDTDPEPNETFFVNLSNPTNATIADSQGLGTILNDEPNAPPTAVDDGPYAATEDTLLTVTAINGVLSNDSDVDGGPSPLTAVLDTGPSNAQSFTLNSDGSFSYTPAADFAGMDSFTYFAFDGSDNSTAATVTITVTGVNDAPSFTKGADQTVLEDSAMATVAGWATAISPGGGADEAGQTVTFNITGNTNSALFSVQPAVASNGDLTFTPATDAFGSATITVVAMDDGSTANGGVDTSPAQMFTITVTGVNDEPSFALSAASRNVSQPAGAQTVPGWATSISAGPANESGQTLTFNVTGNTNPALFSAGPAISSAGTLTYTPAAGAFGTATITVELMDDGGAANGGDDTSPPQSFDLHVSDFDLTAACQGANPPCNSPTMATITAGQSVTFNITGDPKPDPPNSYGNAVTITCVNLPTDSRCTFTPSNTLNLAGGPQTISMLFETNVNAAASPLARLEPPAPERRTVPLSAFWLGLPGVGLLGLALVKREPRKRNAGFFVLLALVLLTGTFFAACGGGGVDEVVTPPPRTPPGTYNVSVTATAGTLSHQTVITIVVQ